MTFLYLCKIDWYSDNTATKFESCFNFAFSLSILSLRHPDIVNCNLSDLMKLKIAEIDICKLTV